MDLYRFGHSLATSEHFFHGCKYKNETNGRSKIVHQMAVRSYFIKNKFASYSFFGENCKHSFL